MKKTIICDIDNTLSYSKFRESLKEKFSRDEIPNYGELPVIIPTLELLKAMVIQGYHILFVSVRGKKNEIETNNWLEILGLNKKDYSLILNEIEVKKINGKNFSLDGKRLTSYNIKSIIYDQKIKGNYEVLFVLEDNEGCVNMWRYDKGLMCYQINSDINLNQVKHI